MFLADTDLICERKDHDRRIAPAFRQWLVWCAVLLTVCFQWVNPLLASEPWSPMTVSPAKQRLLRSKIHPESLAQRLAYRTLFSAQRSAEKAVPDGASSQFRLEERFSLDVFESIQDQLFFASFLNMIHPLGGWDHSERMPASFTSLQGLLPLDRTLLHLKLRGHRANTEAEILALPPEEIDVAHALLVLQFPEDPQRVKFYEMQLDWLALQILAMVGHEQSPAALVDAMVYLLFEEMGFHFPAHSSYHKEVDRYTQLHSVMQAREGICLGVSVVCVALAQRIGVPLEIVTPPGHIFVRYRDGNRERNIETTARGIHLDSSEYLGITLLSLPVRSQKEVIGMVYFNQAGCLIQQRRYDQALECYRKAIQYSPGDPYMLEFMGYAHLFLGNQEEARRTLAPLEGLLPCDRVMRSRLLEDYFKGVLHPDIIALLIEPCGEELRERVEKRKQLESLLQRYPRSSSLHVALAMLWIELHRLKCAVDVLEKYVAREKEDAEAHYLLSLLYMEREDYSHGWHHFQCAKQLLAQRGAHPKAMTDLERALMQASPL